MTNTQKLIKKSIKEITEAFPLMLKVHVPLECELTVRNVVTGEVMIGQKWRTETVLKNIIKRIAESAKADRDKEILEMLPERVDVDYTASPEEIGEGIGYNDCLWEVKALLLNHEAK